jgi:putative OPT family oligopeptide transporter
VVCTALATAGAFITDLKVGYWLGSTPARQEKYKFLGIIVSAACITGVILLLHKVYGFSGEGALAAPQANAMAAVIKTLMSESSVPWGLYIAGGFMALVLEMLKISPLPFALGMYLPIQLNTPILIGGIVAHFVSNSSKHEEVNKKRKDRGTLIASGFVAGGALMGIVSAFIAFIGWDFLDVGLAETALGEVLSVLLFAGLCFYLYFDSRKGAEDKTA